MAVVESVAKTSFYDRFARWVTELLAPSVIVISIAFLVSWGATHSLVEMFTWGLIVALTSSAFPMLVIIYGAKRGLWDGHHIRNRDGRLVPILVLLFSSAIGLALLVALDGPREVILLDITMIATLFVSLVITSWWKISFHTSVLTGTVVILAAIFTPFSLTLLVLVPVVGWSRVRVRDHSVAQVVAGSLLGLAMGGVFFFLY